MSIQEEIDCQPTKTCKICCKSVSRYTCPKCGVPYCSLDCYKSESHQNCSEHFYKDCFMTELGTMKAGGDEKKKMLEMLQKFEKDDLENNHGDIHDGIDGRLNSEDDDDGDHDGEDSGGDSGGDIEERFKNCNIDDADVDELSDLLTSSELEQFSKQLKSGVALENLPDLMPWWCQQKNKSEETTQIPQKLKNIKPLKDLIKGKISPNIPYDIVNLLFSYCYLYRLHHGLLTDLPVLFSLDVIRLSLASSISFVDVDMALCDTLYKLSNECQDLHENDDYTSNVINDVILLLTTNKVESLTLNALSDVVSTIKMCKCDSEEYDELDSKQRQDIKKAKMKLNFYLSWIQENGETLYSHANQITFFHEKFTKELKNKNDLRKFISLNRNKLNTQNKILDIDDQ